MKKLILPLLFVSSSALALTQTQQTLTPKAGQNEVDLGLNLRGEAGETKSSVKFEGGKVDLAAGYYYGINENNSVGIEVGYSKEDLKMKQDGVPDQELHIKGLTSLDINYKGNFDIGPTLYLKVGVSIPAEKKKVDVDNMELSSSTGQIATNLAAGLVVPVSQINLGTIVGYSPRQEGDVEYTSSGTTKSGKIKDGNTTYVSLFGEFQTDFFPNLSLTWQNRDKNNFSGSSFNGSYVRREDLNLRFALRIIPNETVEILPYAELGTILNKSDFNYDKQVTVAVGGNLRLLF